MQRLNFNYWNDKNAEIAIENANTINANFSSEHDEFLEYAKNCVNRIKNYTIESYYFNLGDYYPQ